ncbi:MAG: redoxin family protein [Gammaproteobacteria bacterium]|nr:redoxin family protein [Gammaproteobacteria bacterium]MBV9621407.1 redoxin family protein [Gammaproteobacteria bacterium]
MSRARSTLLALAACVATMAVAAPAPEFTHRQPGEWLNSAPLTLRALRGKVVLIEFFAFECSNCLASRAWLEAVARAKADAGLVVVAVHTPELPQERSAANVREAVRRLGITAPVMLDADYSYWRALDNGYWPAFYLVGRDGTLRGGAIGELHLGTARAQRLEAQIDALLAAR